MHIETEFNPEYINQRYPEDNIAPDLILKAMSGATDAFARLCCEYLEQIYSYIFYQAKDQDTTEELVMEIFLEAFKKIQTYKNKIEFSLWLYRITHDYLAADPRFFSNIPFLEKQIIILKFVQGLNNQAIAWITGQKISFINALQARALIYLKRNDAKSTVRISRSFCEALDNCFLRVASGESIDRCLFQNAGIRDQLEPLLLLGLSIASHPKIKPRDNLKLELYNSLVTRFRFLSRQFADIPSEKIIASLESHPVADKPEVINDPVEGEAARANLIQKIFFTIRSSPILSVSLAVVFVVILAAILMLSGILPKFTSNLVNDQFCTLEVISGNVSLQNPGEKTFQSVSSEVNVPESARIKTGASSQSVLTCQDGSQITLGSNTEIEILSAKYETDMSIIEINQFTGKITSTVKAFANPDSRFAIDTPAALITVIGTQFVTEITPDGSTCISVIKGTVNVRAKGKDLLVEAGYQLTVAPGTTPGVPSHISPTEQETHHEENPALTPPDITRFNLTLKSTDGGRIIIPDELTGEYDAGSVIMLEALADPGYMFSDWSGDIEGLTDTRTAKTSLTIHDNCTITANFVKTYTLTIRTHGGSIKTPGDSSHEYPAGAVVNLSVVPDSGYEFASWTGNTSTIADVRSAETTITIKGDCDITANFVRVYKLTVNAPKGGWIIKPGTGTFIYPDGAQVEVLAIPDNGYIFAGWTCDGNDIFDPNSPGTKITINKDSTLNAKFVMPVVLSTLNIKAGVGGRIVVPEEGTFTCKKGAVVNLEAVPNKGYGFLEWTGDIESIGNVSSPKTTIVMNGNYNITAVFVPAFELTVNTSAGGVILQPGGITYTYNAGTIVPLKAVPMEGYRFINWTGDVTTVENPESAITTITIVRNTTITANFVRDFTVTISAASGGIVVQPGCGTFNFIEGSEINLIAVADTGYTFTGWTINGSILPEMQLPTITITVRDNLIITANFSTV